jgi:transcriptional regulator with XRE-family HTH domain
LADYFEQTGQSQISLARQLKVSKSYMSMLAKGERQPSLALAVRIEGLTGVPAASMVTAERVAS